MLWYTWGMMHSRKLFVLLFLSMAFLYAPSADALTCVISADKVIDQAYVNTNTCTSIEIQQNVSTTWIGTVDLGGGTVTVNSGVRMTMGTSSVMILGATDDVVVNGIIDHATSSPSGVQITARNITINASGAINANGLGCRGGGSGGSSEAMDGYGPNLTTGICALQTSGYGKGIGGAGSYGGRGGRGHFTDFGVPISGPTYGTSTTPTFLGAGGGGGANGGEGGGNGGGKIILNVSGTMTLDGTLAANGQNAGPSYSRGGGGSGGSVYIQTGTLAGTGTVSANGGNGVELGGGGGGGRIAVLYSALSNFSLSNTYVTSVKGVKGAGGGSETDGADGTVYTLQTNQTPDVPSSLGQAGLVDGSTTGTNNPVMTFTLSDPDVADTVRYQIQIDDSSDYSSPVVDYTSALASQGARTFQVGQSLNGGTYAVGSAGQALTDGSWYWRVRTLDSVGAVSSYVTANAGVAFVVDTAARTIQFTFPTASGLENVAATSARISLNIAHFEDVTVSYAATNGSAEGSGTDYTVTSSVATITAGQTFVTIPLSIVEDQIDEPDETFTVTLSSPTFASLGSNTAHVYTITDNDTSGVTVTESSGSTSATEGGATDSYTVVLDSQPTSTVRITFATSTRGVTLSSMFLDFTSVNWNTPQTVTVTATNDEVFEDAHSDTITHTISIPSGYAYGYSDTPPSISDVAVSITDNDTAGVTVSAISGSATEGGSTATYTIVLTSQPTSTVAVALTEDPSEVSLSASTLSFTSSNWSTPQTITVTAINDDIDEATVATSVTHIASVSSGFSRGYDVSLSISSASVSVVDNDTAGVTVTESSGSTAVTEGGSTDSYTLVLTSQPTSTIRITLSAGADTAISTSTIDFTSSNWNAPVTVTVTAIDDDIDEPSETETLSHTLSVPSGFSYGYSGTPPTISDVVATITDNDTAGVTISAISGPATEGGSAATYTIVLTSQPTSTVSVALTEDPSSISLSASTLSFTSLNWSTPQTVTITAVDDDIDEPTAATSVTHLASVPSGFSYGYDVSLSISSASVSVVDDDVASVTVTESSGSTSVTEGGTTDSYTIVLGSQPTSTVRITFTTSTRGVVLSSMFLDFTSLNWNTPQTVTVTATNDEVFEDTHTDTITHTLSIPSGFSHGYSVSPPSISDVTTSITDNDTAGVTLSSATASLTEGGSTATYTIVLTSQPTSTLTMTVTPNTTALSLSPTTLSFTSSNWSSPQTVTLSPTDNSVSDGTKTVIVSHAISSSLITGYPLSLTIGSLTASVADNDQNTGGGGAAAGSGAASALGIPATFSFTNPITPPPASDPVPPVSPPIPPSASSPAPSTSPSDFPPLPNDSFVNPSDVEQLAARFNRGERDLDAEAQARARVLAHARTFRVTPTEQEVTRLANFLVYGISDATRGLGQGEREALVRDALDTAGGGDHIADLERRTRGAIPAMRNLTRERAQLPRVRSTFRTIYGHDPVFSNPEENLAWNTLMYRIRFERDLPAEREGIAEFRRLFRREPKDPFQWSVVRVLGYVER